MMIRIADPYRSGTNDDPEKITANVHFMESFLRVSGPTEGADQIINVACQLGLKVFFALEDVPDK